MAAIIGHIETFDEARKQWSTYVEWFEIFVEVNGISDEKRVSVFLSVMGVSAYKLLRSLLRSWTGEWRLTEKHWVERGEQEQQRTSSRDLNTGRQDTHVCSLTTRSPQPRSRGHTPIGLCSALQIKQAVFHVLTSSQCIRSMQRRFQTNGIQILQLTFIYVNFWGQIADILTDESIRR